MNWTPFSGNETTEEFAGAGFVGSKRRLKIAVLLRLKAEENRSLLRGSRLRIDIIKIN